MRQANDEHGNVNAGKAETHAEENTSVAASMEGAT
jgi:hypothetical protein